MQYVPYHLLYYQFKEEVLIDFDYQEILKKITQIFLKEQKDMFVFFSLLLNFISFW